MTIPRVSVCIPSFNHVRYLPLTLDSILAQTWQDFEVVIADDGSTDGSLTIARDYARRYPDKIQVVSHPGGVNRGISATCNMAVENSRGEFLAWSGSDDVWYTDKLQVQVELMESKPGLGLVYSLADIIDSDGKMTGEHVGKDITPDPIPMLLAGNYLPALTVLHRRSFHTTLGLYDEQLLYSDWDMWLRIASQYQIGFTNRSLGQYRVHGLNVFAGRDLQAQLRNDAAVMRKIQREAGIIGGTFGLPYHRALIELRLASLLCSLDEPVEARQLLKSAFKSDPGLRTNIPALIHRLEAFKAPFGFYPLVLAYIPAVNYAGRRTFESNYFAKMAAAHRHKNLRKARSFALRCILRDIRWLANRQVVGILVESLIGGRAYDALKKLFLRSKSTAGSGQLPARQLRIP